VSARVTCRDFVAFLADYLAGELAAEQRAAFDFHLSHCPSCVAYMKTYQDTRELARAALEGPDDPVPPDVPEDLVLAILAARGREG
jgi:anti-sigma factor RsiW